jgi:hypothetical protein
MPEIVENVMEAVGWLGVLVVIGLTLRGTLQMRAQERRERSQSAK